MFRNINDSLTDEISSLNSMSYPGEVDMSMSSVTAGNDSQSSTNFNDNIVNVDEIEVTSILTPVTPGVASESIFARSSVSSKNLPPKKSKGVQSADSEAIIKERIQNFKLQENEKLFDKIKPGEHSLIYDYCMVF